MILGFAAAATGDWFLAGPGRDFTWGVVAFSVAQGWWMAANWDWRRIDGRLAVAVALPLAALFVWRIVPVVRGTKLPLMIAYSVVSLAALAVASGTRRVWYLTGVSLLFVSDVCIALRMARVPYWQYGIGPLYVASILCLIVSTVRGVKERRIPAGARLSKTAVVCAGVICYGFFLVAIAAAPEAYNPCMRMLSWLGRTTIKPHAYPLCHYLFSFGMLVSAAAIVGSLADWGGLLAASGLVVIAAVPENVSMVGHNAGCYLAVIGGAVAMLARAKDRFGRRAVAVLLSLVGVFGFCLVLHSLKVIPFAPAVPTLQKALIVSFATWVLLERFRHD